MESVVNKKAYFDYEILETYDVGIILAGPEVKSAKRGQVDLSNSYIHIDQTMTPWLTNAHIAPYQPAWQVQQNYDPNRPRKLLLKKSELLKLTPQIKEKGLTIVPLKVYTKGGLVKLQIGLARGKKKYDRREAIKKRETERSIKQAFKN